MNLYRESCVNPGESWCFDSHHVRNLAITTWYWSNIIVHHRAHVHIFSNQNSFLTLVIHCESGEETVLLWAKIEKTKTVGTIWRKMLEKQNIMDSKTRTRLCQKQRNSNWRNIVRCSRTYTIYGKIFESTKFCDAFEFFSFFFRVFNRTWPLTTFKSWPPPRDIDPILTKSRITQSRILTHSLDIPHFRF